MIYGNISELKQYKGLSEKIDKVISIIESGEYKNGVVGKNVVDGDEIFYNIESCKTKDINDCFFELHKKYIDIHIVIDGEEGIGFALKNSLKEESEYNSEKDFQVFDGFEEQRYTMNPDNFILFFPEEPHMPLISIDEAKDIKKVVFKIKL